MTDLPNSPRARDLAYHFLPAANPRRNEETGPVIIERGQGIHVIDDQGSMQYGGRLTRLG